MQASAADTVDPFILMILMAVFIVGAVVPFAICIVGAIQDDRARRRASDIEEAGPIAQSNIVPAVSTLSASDVTADLDFRDFEEIDPANDAPAAVPSDTNRDATRVEAV